jgi:F5/8 type C domain
MSVNKFGAGLKSVGGTNKSYVDNKLKTLMVSKVNKVGDELSGDLNILLNEDKLRSFGVTDINPGKSVSLLLGDINNQIRHNYGHPIKIAASHGIKVTCPGGEVCRWGSQTDARATFFKDIVVNNNFIKELHNPEAPQDAATKCYVDNKKSYSAYVPILESNMSRLGFSVSASAASNNRHQPYGAFNNLNADGSNGSWVSPTTTAWLQIKCPEPVKIWRVAIKARNMRDRDITAWILAASNNGTAFTTLLTSTTVLLGSAATPTFIDVTANDKYQYYRLNVTSSTGSNDVGVQVFQLYVYSA